MPKTKINVMTFNLSSRNKKNKKIDYRSKDFIPFINGIDSDIFCFQEATYKWMDILTKTLKGFECVSQFRHPDKSPEACPIFYKKERFELLDSKTFWLSETPNVQSKSWGSCCYRICTYVILKDKQTGTRIAVFNTHLDHRSLLAKVNGINLILNRINEYKDSCKIILTGDFNSFENSAVYQITSRKLLDSKKIAAVSMNGKTYNDYKHGLRLKLLPSSPIDYVWLGKNDDVVVNEYRILNELGKSGNYISDHFALFTDICF